MSEKMENTNKTFEEHIMNKLIIEEYIKQFDPEIQAIFYHLYGENLEAIPEYLLHNVERAEKFFEVLLTVRNPKHQKIILMRFGFVTGSPMALQEVAEEFGMRRERVRQIESVFLRRIRYSFRNVDNLEKALDSDDEF